ncbi:MAG: NAD(P)H-dependent oxidoreductase, partial [Gemmatimonadaceae bacterium]
TEGYPIRVAIIGAGATGRAIALQLATPVPGIRLAGIANRTTRHAERAFREAGIATWSTTDSAAQVADSVARGVPVLTDDPSLLVACPGIDIVLEVTGTVDVGAATTLDAIAHGKHAVIVNAELDSTIGPILKARADQAGVVLTNTDGDEPGVAMTLYRYVKSLGLTPVAAGNIKGMVDYYRNPDTQRAFAEKNDQDPWKVTSFADATKLSMETTVLANATGFHVGRRGMYGPACANVKEMASLLPPADMLAGGIVDYALGAAPHTGAFVVVHEDNALKQAQLAYYKMGDGPFYVFYTPFHLPHLQIASTIGRAVLLNDATVAPLAGPQCEVVAVAKRDLTAGETIDGIGGFTVYGLIENTAQARAMDALPMGLAQGCVLKHAVSRDRAVTARDVTMPAERLSDRLWAEQRRRWAPFQDTTGRPSRAMSGAGAS